MSETEEKTDEAASEKPGAIVSTIKDLRWKIFAIVGVLSLIADQATKIWARHVLPVAGRGACEIPYDLIPHDGVQAKCHGVDVPFISGFWEWRLSMNTGSAFGLFGNNPAAARIFLSVVGVVAVGGMVWMLKKSRTDQRILQWALAFVAGGAVGNLIDRIYFGAVTDMVSWHYKKTHWPVFNVADVVLVVGVGLMFIDIQKESKREKAEKKARAEARKRKLADAGLVKHQ